MTDFDNREPIANTQKYESSPRNEQGLGGQVIAGRYRVTEPLGGGGMGEVYLTEDVKLERPVVIKLLQQKMLKDERVRKKFEYEKKALIELSNKGVTGIVHIYDSGTWGGRPFIVMEYVAGEALSTRLAKRRPTSEEAADILEQLGAVLKEVHQAGIIHRDIKPSNIMLRPQSDGKEQVVLIDFGIAGLVDRAGSDSHEDETRMGTPKYAPPEQSDKESKPTEAWDVYAYTAVAYELLTREQPFPKGRKPGDRLTEVGGVSPEVNRLLQEGLEFDGRKRRDDIGKFSCELVRALRQSAVTLPAMPNGSSSLPPTMPMVGGHNPLDYVRNERGESQQASHRLPSRQRFSLIVVGVAALLILVGGLVAWYARSPVTPPVPSAPPPVVQPALCFNYAVEVQKMRNGKPFQAPYWATGREVFETGYRFRVEITPDRAGDLYVFADGKDRAGKPEINLLFPTPKQNGGSPAVVAGQKVQTGQNTFTGSTGNEVLYLIWSAEGSSVLEEARKACWQQYGKLRSSQIEADLRRFLRDATKAMPKVEFIEDDRRPFGRVYGTGEVVVYRLELKHR